MSLYDDIGLDQKELGGNKADSSGWSVGHRLLHSRPQRNSKSLNPSFSKRRGGGSLAPVVDLNRGSGDRSERHSVGSSLVAAAYGGFPGSTGGRDIGPSADDGEIRFNHITGKMEAGPPPKSFAQFGVATYHNDSPFSGMSSEYDPAFPNEYKDFSKRLEKLREADRVEEKRRETEERMRRREEERREKLERIAASFKPPTALYNEPPKETESTKRLALYGSDSDSEGEPDRKPDSGAAFAPPPMLLEESNPSTPPSSTEEGFSIVGKGGSVASKIMAKMGYKHGSGLGREEQGMSMALQVEKTGRRGGKILHEKDIAAREVMPAAGQPKADTGITNTELLRNPSKVLLLMNMVGPGEVDEELEPETAEECGKYGKVVKCVIFEMPNLPETEAVRIFVEFEKISFAIKAAIDLNGRFFGGRVVRASFYSHEKFLNLQLNQEPL